jgi:hypothetical protein
MLEAIRYSGDQCAERHSCAWQRATLRDIEVKRLEQLQAELSEIRTCGFEGVHGPVRPVQRLLN